MPIIAAMRESDDSILIGADTGSSELRTGFRFKDQKKLQKHPKAALAWGVSGSPYLGLNRFGKFLQMCDEPRCWEDLIREARGYLVELVRPEVEFARRIYQDPLQTVDVLLAGWINDEPGILTLPADGPPDLEQEGFHAIGIQTSALYLTSRVLESVEMSNIEKFKLLMECAADSFAQCSLPVHIWRITKDGVKPAT